jgi:hypothetical protein
MQRSPAASPTRPAVHPPRVAGCVSCVVQGHRACVCGGVELASETSIHYLAPAARPGSGHSPRRAHRFPPSRAGSRSLSPSSSGSSAPPALAPASTATSLQRRPGAHRRGRRRKVMGVFPPFMRRWGRARRIDSDKPGRRAASDSTRWRARTPSADQASTAWPATRAA